MADESNKQEDAAGAPDSAADSEDRKRPRFGTRLLTDNERVFEHNAWDHVGWDDEQERHAQEVVRKQALGRVDDQKQETLEADADKFWDVFYSHHQNKFFKDRHWLMTEFPELAAEDPAYRVMPAPRVSGGRGGAAGGGGGGDDDDAEDGEGREAQDVNSSQHCADVSTTIAQESTTTPAAAAAAAAGAAAAAAAAGAADTGPQHGHGDGGSGSTFTQEVKDDGRPLIEWSAHSTKRVMEVGCGVGNTVFPLLAANRDPGLFVYACDFAPTAVSVLKSHAQYEPQRCCAFVCDVATEPVPLPEGSLDIAIMIFVLSAIHPDKMSAAIARVVHCLKPGGILLLRDYGRYDMAQLRFKGGRYLSENFYMRGDGTRVYFFTQEELKALLVANGLVEEQNIIDRRLIINRGRRLKMNRIWIQCKYRKPLLPA